MKPPANKHNVISHPKKFLYGDILFRKTFDGTESRFRSHFVVVDEICVGVGKAIQSRPDHFGARKMLFSV